MASTASWAIQVYVPTPNPELASPPSLKVVNAAISRLMHMKYFQQFERCKRPAPEEGAAAPVAGCVPPAVYQYSLEA
jgi:hypothetical protein